MSEGLTLPPRPNNGNMPLIHTPQKGDGQDTATEKTETPDNTPAVNPPLKLSTGEPAVQVEPRTTPTPVLQLDIETPDTTETENDNPVADYWEKQEEDTAVSGPVMEDSVPKVEISTATETQELNIDDLLLNMLKQGGSDLHLSAKNYPMMRVHGSMVQIEGYPRISGEQIHTLITSVMRNTQRNKFDDEWELDFAYDLVGKSRFRVNVMRQRGQTSVVMRTIPWEIKTVEQLGIPEVVRDWAMLPRGLVLITGPTGSGKSTTLAAIIDHANRTRAGHIVTIEDPIEFVHEHQKSVINQREVGTDTKDFQTALKHVLRQDPDIILVGEMRDRETIEVALSAAETGHLVFGTLHTQSAGETVSRIVDVFPADAQQQVRTQLAATIQGVACQTLLKTRDGKGRVAAVEIMTGEQGIRAQIRDGKIGQLRSSIQAGGKMGMQTLDMALKRLVESGKVRWQDAAEKALTRKEFIDEMGGESALMRKDRVWQEQYEEGL